MRLRGRRKHGVREAKRQARQVILREANAHRGSMMAKPYSMRTLHRAVHAVRQKRLCKPALIAAAGFNPKRRRKHDPVVPRF